MDLFTNNMRTELTSASRDKLNSGEALHTLLARFLRECESSAETEYLMVRKAIFEELQERALRLNASSPLNDRSLRAMLTDKGRVIESAQEQSTSELTNIVLKETYNMSLKSSLSVNWEWDRQHDMTDGQKPRWSGKKVKRNEF